MNKLLFSACLLCLTLLPIQLTHAQIVINEIAADPGNYDGQGAEWTELYNAGTAAVDISCYVLTDGEEIILFPSGTYLPAGGYLLVYNSNFFSCATCNWDPAISALIDNVGSPASPDPDGTTSVDVATCGCTNQTAASCFAVTWDNGGNTDRVALFDANATIVDAVYWGDGAKEAPAGASIPEGNFTQGPLTTGTGGDIAGGGTTGCTLPAANDYTIPALPAPASSNAVWEFAGPDNVGCTTSYGRIINGVGSGQADWAADVWPTPGQSNTIADYGISYAVSGGSAINFTTSDAITINVCSGATLTFSADINAFNQVFNDADGDAGNAVVLGSGSLINAAGGLSLTNQAWTEAAITTAGVTNLSYTTTAITNATTITLKIKENTQASPLLNSNASGCAGAGANIGGSGAAGECYINKVITVNVVNPVTAISYTCTNGVVTVTTTPASGFGAYNLFLDNSTNNTLDRNFTVTASPFVFSVTQGTATDYTLTATGPQTPNCGALPAVTGGPLCVFAPPCPSFTAYDACSTAAGAKCPGDVINLSLTGTNLPNGGTIQWVNDTNNNNNVYDEPVSSIIATQSITVGEPVPSGSPVLNEVLPDATIETSPNFGEGWEIAGTPGTGIGCYYFTDGDWVVQLPSTAVIPANGFYVVGTNFSDAGWNTHIDYTLTASSSAGGFPNLTNPGTNGEFLVMFNASNAFVNGVYWGASTAGVPSPLTTSNAPATSGAPTLQVAGAGCPALPANASIQTAIQSNAGSVANSNTTTSANEQTVERATDVTGTWQLSANPGGTTNTMGGSNIGTTTILSPTCAAYNIPLSACNTTLNIKPRISPDQTGCSPGSASPTLATRTYTVTCPTAGITGEAAICAAASASMPVVITNNPVACTNAIIQYSVNGGATQSFGPATISGGIVTVTGLNTGTPGMTASGGTVTLVGVAFSGGGCTACPASLSGSFAVTVAVNPAAPVASSQDICNGQASILTATGTDNLNWYSDAGLTTQIGSGASIAYTGTGSTTLYVQSTNPDTGCKSASTPVVVTANPVPSAVPTGSSEVCAGQSITLNAGASGGTLTYTYFWSEPLTGGTLTSINTPTTGISNAVAGDAGVYTVLVTDSKNCYVRATKSVTVNALPAASISGTTSYCGTAGPATPLTASGGDTYLWSTNATTAAITPDISTVGQTTYTVTVTNSVTGCSATASTMVSVNPLFNICQGATISASTTGCNVTTPYAQVFLLTDAAGLILQIDNVVTDCAATFATALLTAGNTYHVYALNYDTTNPPSPNYGLGVNVNSIGSITQGCYNTDTFLPVYMCYTIVGPPACLISGNTTVCPSSANVYAVATPMTGYAWSISGNGSITGALNGASVTVTAGTACSTPFTLSVTVTDANGCTSSCSQPVDVNDATPPAIQNCAAVTAAGPVSLACNTAPSSAMALAAMGAISDNCGLAAGSPTVTPGVVTGICNKTQTFTISATNLCGSTTSCDITYTWTDDTTAPSFALCTDGDPANNTIALGCNPAGLPTVATVIAAAGAITEGCGLGTNTPVASVTSTSTVACVTTQVWTVSVTDACGNTGSCDITYTWTTDTTAPSFALCTDGDPTNNTIALGCNPAGLPTVATVIAAAGAITEGCGLGTNTPVASVTSTSTVACVTTQVWTVSVTDACGNTGSCDITYTWTTDTTAPSFALCTDGDPANNTIALGCNPAGLPTVATVIAAAGAITEGCGLGTNTPVASVTSTSTVACITTQVWTVSVTDACGNTGSCDITYTWTTDTTAPSFAVCPSNLVLICDGNYATEINNWLTTASATDACGATITNSLTPAAISTLTCDAGSVTVIFTAADACGNTATCSSQIQFTQNPSIQLYKTISSLTDNGDGVTGIGDIINYAFTVTNTGNVTLTNITLNDPLIFETGGPIGSLAPGASNSTVFTGIYIITQADVNTGYVQNTAMVTGVTPSGGSVTDISDAGNDTVETPSGNGGTNGNPTDDPTVQPLNQSPAIQLYKYAVSVNDVNGNGYNDAGDVVHYTFTVTNTGNVTLYNIIVADPLVTVVGAPITSLLPGASNSTTFTATYTITAADVNIGYVENTATVTGYEADGTPVTDISDAGNDATETGDGDGTTNGNPTDDPTVVVTIPPCTANVSDIPDEEICQGDVTSDNALPFPLEPYSIIYGAAPAPAVLYSLTYLLTDVSGNILQVSNQGGPYNTASNVPAFTYSGLAAGNYRVYEVIYLTTDGSLTNTGVGNNINSVGLTNTASTCLDATFADLLIHPRPAVVSLTSNSPLCSGNNLLIDLQATNVTVNGVPGFPIAGYQWDVPVGPNVNAEDLLINNATTADSGLYTVTITDSFGCSATSSTTATVNQTPVLAEVHTNVSCNGGTNGTITVSPTPSTGAYTYTWSAGGSTSNTASGLPAGTYTVTATLNGCSATISATITQPTALTASIINITQPNCFNGVSADNGTATVDVTGGTSPYGYLWTSGATTATVSNLAPGNYSVTVTDFNNCTVVLTNALVLNAPDCCTANVSDIPDQEICQGYTGTLVFPLEPYGSLYGSAPAPASLYSLTYVLTTSGGTILQFANMGAPYNTVSNTPPFTYSGLAAGNYRVYEIIWRTADGPLVGLTTGGNVAVVDLTNPNSNCLDSTFGDLYVNPAPVATANSNSPVCAGNALILTATGGVSYAWSSTAAIPFSSTSNFAQINAASSGNSGTYTVTVTANGCTATASQAVTVNTATASITAGGATTFCSGGSVTLTASGGGTYLWSTGATTEAITATASGTYTVTVTANGCTATASQTVTVNSVTASIVPAGPTTFCSGGSVTLIANGGGTYQWSNSAATQSIVVTNGGTYTVTVTGNGCTATASQTVTVNSVTASIVPAGPTTFCSGGSVTLIANGGGTYQWSNGAATQSIVVTNGGTYTVTVTGNGCTATASQTVTVNSVTASIVPAGPTTFCSGGSVTLIANGGGTYQWSNGAATQSIVVTNGGSYTVTVTATGCTATASQAVTVNTATASITAGGATTFCAGGSVTLTASGGGTYLWSTGATSAAITATTSGTYTVTVTGNGCTATASQTVTVNSVTASIVPAGPTTFCSGGSVTLIANGGGTYQWSNGAATQSIVVTNGGSYTVTVTANGCTATASQAVTVTPQNIVLNCPASPAPVNATSCSAFVNVAPLSVSVSCGTYSASFEVYNTNAVGNTNAFVRAGTGLNATGIFPVGVSTVIFTVTGATGNTSTCSMTVTVNDLTTPVIVCPEAEERTIYTNVDGSGNCTAAVIMDLPTYYDNCNVVSWSYTAINTYQGTITNITATLTGAGTGNNASGIYPVGETVVTYTVTDGYGNSSNCVVTVTVIDNELPALSCPSNVNVNNTTGSCGATVNIAAPSATDNCGIGAITNNLTGGSTITGTYPAGTTVVTWTATDVNGNVSTCSSTITVNDTQAPVLGSCPSDITSCNPEVTFVAPSYTDNCSGTTLTVSQASGSTFASGTTVVTYTASDASGNTAACSFTVTVLSIQGTLTVSNYNGFGVSCNGGLNGSATLTMTSGVAPFTFTWSNGFTQTTSGTSTVSGLGAGLYAVTVTSSSANNGCTYVRQFTILQPLPLNCAVTGTNVNCGDTTGSGTVNPSGGVAPYTYLWSNGATTQSITGLAAGQYYVTLTDANGCVCTSMIDIKDTGSIGDGSLTAIYQGAQATAIPTFYNVDIITISGGTQPYLYQWTTSGYVQYGTQVNADGSVTITIVYADSAVWDLTVTDSSCLEEQLYFDNQPDTPTSSELLDIINYVITPDNGSQNGTITLTVEGGTPCPGGVYNYAWEGPTNFTGLFTNGPFQTGLVTGWYIVTVTDCGGQETIGWYWVPKTVRGRGKLAENEMLTAYPNPFTQSTTIEFSLPETTETTVKVYNVEGKEVRQLFKGMAEGGELYSVEFDGNDLPSGVYLVSLTGENGGQVRYRLMLTK